MGLCHSQNYNRRSSSANTRKNKINFTSLDKDSNSTQINEKRRGKTPSINSLNNIKALNNKDNLSEKEYDVNKLKKNKKNAKFDIISEIDKMSNYSEKIKYDIMKEEKERDIRKEKNNQSFFNKVRKLNNDKKKNNINKKQPMINIRTKFNNFSKKGDETPIKLRNLENNESQNISIINTIEKEKSKIIKDINIKKDKIINNNANNIRENNKNEIILTKEEKLFFVKNNTYINFKNNTCLYIINDANVNDNENDVNKNKALSSSISSLKEKYPFSNEDLYKTAKNNLKDRNAVSNNILHLPERKWYDELIDLSDFLIRYRDKLDMKNLCIYIVKLIRIYEDFNWLIDSISSFYINIKYKNLQYNKEGIDLPEINSEVWKKGFKWKGVYIKINEGNENKTIFKEIKALNYFFFEYIQIIDKYQFVKDNQLSNNIIFPLIGYSYINGKTLIVSALIDANDNDNIKMILNNKNNYGIIKLYNNINNNAKNANNDNIDNIKDIEDDNKHLNLINTMGKKFYIDDLLISKLFYNLNEAHLIKIKHDKFIIFNVYKFIPDLFNIDYDTYQKINFFSTVKNKKIFYTLNYDLKNKININKESNKYKTPKDVIYNLYHINSISLIKSKNIIINNIIFKIFYQNEIQIYETEIKSKNYLSKNFVDNLFNYSFKKRYMTRISKIKEPYVILYDLITPLKLQYSLIKSNKNYVLNGQNISNEEIKNIKNKKKIEKNIYFLESNYISHFISWCNALSKNSFNIKTYSDLKTNMKKYGINSILRFFALMLINNNEIKDIIKISFLIKVIKCTFIKETNNLKYNEEGIKFILMKYIKCILYPSEIISKEKEVFNNIFQEIIFYSNVFFLKLKLIDNYLNLNILNISDIKDINNNIFKEEHIKLISKKLTELNSPEDFLLHIISVARKMPFIFLTELEQKLNFIINPYIKFKSSLSIESFKNKLNMEHIILNFSNKTFSYIKSNELSGLLLAKIITRFNSYELDGTNFFNKVGINSEEKKEKINNNNIQNYNFNINLNKKSPKNLKELNKSPYFIDNYNNKNIGNENVTNNSDISKEYTNFSENEDLDLLYFNENIKQKNKINQNGDNKYTSQNKNYLIKQHNILSDDINNDIKTVEWDHIKHEFLFELPPICYKMSYLSNEIDKKIEKYKNLYLYKNLSYIYNIINPKILIEWSELIERILSKINSCNGEAEHTLLYSLFYLFIYHFFFGKKSESNLILLKINKLYLNQEYKLSLNDLIIINLFNSMLNNINFIKSEENFSKCVILILMAYGDPRGRQNDSHGILEYPLWELCYRTVKLENITVSEYFREMLHALDYFQWNKSLIKLNNISNNNIEKIFDNNNCNIDEILILNNINKDMFTNNESNSENKLSYQIFDEKILKLKCIKHFNFPKMNQSKDKIETIFNSKTFILYLIKQIQSLFLGKKIFYNQNYINNIISPDIFNPEKFFNSRKNKKNMNTFMNVINLNTNRDKINNAQRLNSASNSRINSNRVHGDNYVQNEYSYKNKININVKQNQNNNNKLDFFEHFNLNLNNQNNNVNKYITRPSSSKKDNKITNINYKYSNIFSRYLYLDLLTKLSYVKNIPSGVAFSFGNNRHSETSHDNLLKITIPRIIFKLKNYYIDKIFSGWEHNIIITKEGELFAFGNNKNYQCGLPNISSKNNFNINNPTNISKYNNNFKAISASCGNDHTLILKNDFSVYAFGNNEEGELGLKDRSIKTYKFNKINFGNDTNKIIKISAGTVHNLALTLEGKIYSWGSSQGGQLGLKEEYLLSLPDFKETYNIHEPKEIDFFKEKKLISISCGEAHSAAVDIEGKTWTWGYGSNGQLGLGFCEDDFEPGISQQKTRIFLPHNLKVLEKEKIEEVKCGKTFSMFLNEKREIYACGVNDLNQLGIDVKCMKHKKICYDVVIPTKLEYLMRQKVIKLSCGEGHCIAIISGQENSNVIWSWGNNKFGQLGHGINIDKSLPKPINYLLGFTENKDENDAKIQFEDISCGGFHSLCLEKYKEELNWIEIDNKIIENAIKNKDKIERGIFYSLNNESQSDIKSEIIDTSNITLL